jgi:hypothetical protein
MPLFSPIHATSLAGLILLNFITQKILGEEYRSQSSSLCSFFHSAVTSFLLGPNILLYNLFSNTLPQCQQPSFTRTQNIDKTIVLYISIFKLLDSKLQRQNTLH